MKKKIGILGGTFNPIHIGHLILAENAYDSLQLEKVLIMPSGISYLKDPADILPAKQRIQMVQLAIGNNKHLELSTFETDRPGNSYTHETLTQLQEKNPDCEYYFIIGADSLFNIEQWKEPQVVLDHCVLVAAPRYHMADEALFEQKSRLERFYHARVHLLNTPNIDISSNMIRARIIEKRTICYYVPKDVEMYIYKKKLYRK
ncbi:MAG: nicotinate-nucleotide adenylyltransferase [Lachnospiraceae bacterium]